MPFRCCLLAIAIAFPAAVSAATTYTATDLGTLGGASSYGTAIGEDGAATGYSDILGGGTRGFIWTIGGGMQSLGVIGGGDSRGLDINGDNIVGQTSGQSFRWTPGSGMVLIDGANTGSANGLNNSDAFIGERNLLTVDRTIKWGAANTLSSPFPASNSRGVAVNDLGQLVVETNIAGG